jgi:hypothetical protein
MLTNLDEILNILIFQLTLSITPKLKYKLVILAAVLYGLEMSVLHISHLKLIAHFMLYLLYTVHT